MLAAIKGGVKAGFRLLAEDFRVGSELFFAVLNNPDYDPDRKTPEQEVQHNPENVSKYLNNTIMTHNNEHEYNINADGHFEGWPEIEGGRIALTGSLINDIHRQAAEEHIEGIKDYDRFRAVLEDYAAHPLQKGACLAICLAREDAKRFGRNGFVSSKITDIIANGPLMVEAANCGPSLELHRLYPEFLGYRPVDYDTYSRDRKTGQHTLNVHSQDRFENLRHFRWANLTDRASTRPIYPLEVKYNPSP